MHSAQVLIVNTVFLCGFFFFFIFDHTEHLQTNVLFFPFFLLLQLKKKCSRWIHEKGGIQRQYVSDISHP